MLDWLRKRQRVRTIPAPLWEGAVMHYPFLAARGALDLARLRELAGYFLATKEFHGAHEFVITDEVALAIAVQAVLPVLHLGKPNQPQSALGWYDDFVGIVVHHGDVIARRTMTDDAGIVHQYSEVLAGEAMDRGPVMLNWRDVDNAGKTAAQGYNVVIHEFIHKIDMRDGVADGCPPLPNHLQRAAWRKTMQSEYQLFREAVTMADRFGGDAPWLDAYGAHSLAEFFAVTCEAFFVNRERFDKEFAALPALFDAFFTPQSSTAQTQ